MKKIVLSLLLTACAATVVTACVATEAQAESAGIDFPKMKIGTTITTETLGTQPRRLEEKYLGQDGDFFVMEERGGKVGEPMSSLGKVFYDKQGRRVRSERTRGITYHKPYSCLFASGECTHEIDYPNPFTKKEIKRTTSSTTYNNRLEGNTLFVTWKLVDKSIQEVPFSLGPYRLRVASEYKNRLGQLRGHKLIEIVEPP